MAAACLATFLSVVARLVTTFVAAKIVKLAVYPTALSVA